MLTTEAEAKTKRCQEGYAASPGASVNPTTDYVSQSFMVPSMQSLGGGAAAMATTAAPATAPIFCLGSACMAWRWRGWANHDNASDLPRDNPTAGHPDFKRYGYCGKAGRP